MKYFLLVFSVFCVNNFAKAQLADYIKEFQTYIPKGWVLDTALKGDLNEDQQPDVVLVIRNTNSDNYIKNESLGLDTLDINPRRLLILFKSGSVYKKQLVNDAFLPSVNSDDNPCLADPLMEGFLEIKNGLLKIYLNYWLSCGSWYVTNYNYIFRYQHSKFELIGLDVSSFHRATGESSITSYNFSTGKVQTIEGINEFDETKQKPIEKWEKIRNQKLYNLATMNEYTAIDEIVNER